MEHEISLPLGIDDSDVTCVGVALDMILKYNNIHSDKKELLRALDVVPGKDSDHPSLCLALISFGLNPTYVLDIRRILPNNDAIDYENVTEIYHNLSTLHDGLDVKAKRSFIEKIFKIKQLSESNDNVKIYFKNLTLEDITTPLSKGVPVITGVKSAMYSGGRISEGQHAILISNIIGESFVVTDKREARKDISTVMRAITQTKVPHVLYCR
jgi:hypothetical protein